MPICRPAMAYRALVLPLVLATVGCADDPVARTPRPPMAVYLAIHSRMESAAPVQVVVGRSRLWNAPASRAAVASTRPVGGHYRISPDTVRITATLDDGSTCRRQAVLESRREAWLDVMLEPERCSIEIRYGAPRIHPDSAPWLRSQLLMIAGALRSSDPSEADRAPMLTVAPARARLIG